MSVGYFIRRAAALGIVFVAAFAFLTGQQGMAQQAPDMILHNGKILTVDSNFSTAEAVAISGNKIAAVGKDQDVMKLAGPNSKVIDLKGKTVVPGLIDTHAHIHNYAESAYGEEAGPEKMKHYPVDWRGVTNKDDVLNQVKGVMAKYKFKPGEWIYLENQLSFVGAGSPEMAKILYDDVNQFELDKVTPNNPAVMNLGIPDFNGFLVNKKGWDIVWKDHAAYLKKYGRFWISATGVPDGHIEPPGSRLLFDYLPEPAAADMAPLYKKYVEEWNAAGVTTVSTRLPKYSADTYKLLKSRGELTLRMAYGMEWVFGSRDATDPNKDLKKYAALVGTGDDSVWITSVAPTEVDGATTRACTNQKRGQAYGAIDSYWPSGQCQTDTEFKGAAGHAAPISGAYFREWILDSGRDGLRFANTHVAGDRSVANILEMMQTIQKQHGTSATKGWAMDHCFMVNPKDLPLANRMNVTFSCAPKYVESAPGVAKSYGDDVANTYIDPIKSMLDQNVHVVYESDRDAYPWHDVGLLLTRKDKTGKVWGPQERIDRPNALRMVTRWAAEYVLKPDKIGSIEKGKLADLAVLDKDFLTIPADEVQNIHPQMTLLDGKVIYLHPDFAKENNLKGAVVATYDQLFARRSSKRRADF